MKILPLHNQFNIALEVVKLKLYLKKHPEQSTQLAIEHFQDYLEVVERYKQLEAENNQLKSPSLPPFPTPSHGKLQRNYDELLKSYTEILAERRNLKQENNALFDLLAESNPELPTPIKRRRKS